MIGQPFFYMAFACCVKYIWRVCTQAARKENLNPSPNPHPNSHDHCLPICGNVVRVRILICATR